MMDNREPFIYKTTDFGKSWKKINGDIPASHPLDYVMTVVENPNRKGMLFAGTGRAFYYSIDDGARWTQIKGGLPASPVTWIEVAPREHDVVVSTYGRGLWLLRDLTTLEQADQVRADAPAFLYAPRAGVRQARSGRAEFLYTLKAAGPVTLEILDQSGAVVRAMNATGRAGLNRAVWDLRYEPSPAGGPAHDAARQSAHLGRAAVQGADDAADRALGDPGAAAHGPDCGAGQVHGAPDGGRHAGRRGRSRSSRTRRSHRATRTCRRTPRCRSGSRRRSSRLRT